MFAVIEKSSGDWIGRIGPWHPLHWPTMEVGWGLRKTYWGQGYAFEAASACIDFAFDELDWSEVTHLIEDANTPSQTLAKRLGSVPAEYVHLPGQLSGVRVRVWRQNKTDWQAHR
jgi:RimJ/RimL family protein N-acetyltransferase